MRHIKLGRGPSAFGAMGGIIAVLFSIFWIIMAFTATRNAPTPIRIFFPLFGVVFLIIGIVSVGYNIYNTTQKKRFSAFDITSSAEESDPLNDLISGKITTDSVGETIESKLQKLDQLHKKGLITETEYTTQRQRILNTI